MYRARWVLSYIVVKALVNKCRNTSENIKHRLGFKSIIYNAIFLSHISDLTLAFLFTKDPVKFHWHKMTSWRDWEGHQASLSPEKRKKMTTSHLTEHIHGLQIIFQGFFWKFIYFLLILENFTSCTTILCTSQFTLIWLSPL